MSNSLPVCDVAASVTLFLHSRSVTTTTIFALTLRVSTPPLRHTGAMGLFDRFRNRSSTRRPGGTTDRTGSTTVRASDAADAEHLREFVTTRRGVEGFVEPRTAVSDVTLLLVAHDGEWTRRRVPSIQWAHKFANRHRIPSYDAAVVGVPQRMREWNRRKKAGEL